MKEIYYVYNNEAIASCVFLSVLGIVEELDVARSCLILPFLLDDRTTEYLIKNDVEQFEQFEQFVKEQSRLFASFNRRYLALLPVTVNSLIILNAGNQIQIGSRIISNNDIKSNGHDLGERYEKISQVIPRFLEMIENYSTSELYQILNVQL